MYNYDRRLARMKIFGLDDLIGGAIGAGTSLIAGKIQSDAAKKAAQQANQTLGDAGAKAQNYLNPYVTAGQTGLNAVQSMVQNPQKFSMSDFYNDPGYQFQLQQGNQAIERSAAARGGLTSGATGKALSGYTTNLANTTYGDAYNRYLQTNQQQFNQANTLANYGYGASTNSSQNTLGVGSQQAYNTMNAVTGAGNATAAGVVGAGNAAGQSLSDYYLRQQLGGGIVRPTVNTNMQYGYGGYGQ